MVASLKFPVGLTAVAMDLVEKFLFVGGLDGRIFCVDLSFATPPAQSEPRDTLDFIGGSKGSDDYDTLSGHDRMVSSLSVSMEGNLLLSGSHDGTAKVWDLISRQVIRTLVSSQKGPITVATIIPRPDDWVLEQKVTNKGQEQSSRKLPAYIQPFKPFLHRDESSVHAASSDPRALFKSKCIPAVLMDPSDPTDLQRDETKFVRKRFRDVAKEYHLQKTLEVSRSVLSGRKFLTRKILLFHYLRKNGTMRST
jgi:hypothetical protein